MVRANRRKYRRPPGSPLQPSGGRRTNLCYGLNSNKPQLMRISTDLFRPPNLRPNLPPHRTSSRCNREICPIWTTPLTPLSHRRPHPCLRLTSLQHDGCGWHLPANPNKPLNSKQPHNFNPLSLFGRINHPLYCLLRSDPK